MSYHAMLNFTQTDDVLGLIEKIYQASEKNIEALLLNMWTGLPSQRHPKDKRPSTSFVGWAHDALTIKDNLTRTILYWKNYKIAAIIGDWQSLSKDVIELFPCQIYFQNQSDTDYPLEIYEPIEPFRNIADAFVSWPNPLPEYELKTAVYETICDMLSLKPWIYDKPVENIQVITLQLVRNNTVASNIRECYTQLYKKLQIQNNSQKETIIHAYN